MAEIILLEKVTKLGFTGDIVKVKDGYARYLLKLKRALRATKDNKFVFENQRSEFEKENLAKKSKALEVAEKIENIKNITLIRQAGEDGRLFGSVTSRDISNAFLEQNIELNRTWVKLNDPIKTIGTFEVVVAPHSEVDVTINVSIKHSEDIK